jgi:hypothetical protein
MAPPLTGSSLIPHPPTERQGSMKRILCSLLVAVIDSKLRGCDGHSPILS